MDEKEPFTNGSAGMLEIIDMMCSVTEKMADIVKKQTVMIEQAKIAGAVFASDLSEERSEAEHDLDWIKHKLRREIT